MKHPKTVDDLTHKQITDLWMNEYQYFDSGEDHTTIPSDWPLAFHGGEVAMGDPDWIDDFIMQLGDDGAYRLDGVWGDVFNRVEIEPRLKKMITNAEIKRMKEQEERDEEREKALIIRAERDRIAEIKRLPWISVKTDTPKLTSISLEEVSRKYLVTDGVSVEIAQVGGFEDVSYFFIPGKDQKRSSEYVARITHWMPVERLLLFLPFLEMEA